jgi:hypothetical protein
MALNLLRCNKAKDSLRRRKLRTMLSLSDNYRSRLLFGDTGT